jgi:amino acid transporter
MIGRPLASDELEDQLLPKTLALPVFASDALSSVAYATEETMLVLALAGVTAFRLVTPIAGAIALLFVIVMISYRQTIRAYPDGGGAFIVSQDNLGIQAGMVAAAALLTDYTLTVSVSVAAGTAAITSAFPDLLDNRVGISLFFVAIIAVANLRGTRESSLLFSVPTYAFVATIGTMLIAGFAECADGACPQAVSAGFNIEPEVGALGLFLILRAFASGSTALTGVEAIANGVQAFREPKSRNAAATLALMAIIAISMFLGISTLAHLFGVEISEDTVDTFGTVISQIGRAAFNGGIGFWILQVTTAGILILAANTAYQDFPRLSAILARHKLMPRQFRNLGDRLVFSNGIIVLTGLAGFLIWIFDAQVSRLIQLYVVGVFLSFTLSQTGMVVHWARSRERGWRRYALINGIGAATTAVVLVVIAVVKFSHGAWIVLTGIPLIVASMALIRGHYLGVAGRLRLIHPPPVPTRNRVVLLVSHIGLATRRAVEYARIVQPEHITVLHVRESHDEDLVDTWDQLFPDLVLTSIDPRRGRTFLTVRDFVANEASAHPEAFITVIIPELIRRRRLGTLFFHPHGLMLKFLLLFVPGGVVTDLTYHRPSVRRRVEIADPDHIVRQEVVVLVSEVTIPTRRAIEYGHRLGAARVRSAHLEIDAEQRDRVLSHWESDLGDLEILESPYRGITRPLLRYVRRLRRDAEPGTLINVVIPEFVVSGWRSQLLHNQTAFAVKAALIFEPGVALTSVPWHLSQSTASFEPQPV